MFDTPRLAVSRLCPPTAKKLLLLPAAILLAACATPVSLPPSSTTQATTPSSPGEPLVWTAEQRVLQDLVSRQERLYRTAAPLLINNQELCKNNVRNLLGFTAKNKYSYSSEFIQAAQNVLRLDERLQVMSVLPGSGAAYAGIQRGDTLLAVEGIPLPGGENAERRATAILAPLVTNRLHLKLSVMRDGTNMSVDVPLTPACAFGIELGNTDNVTAYADGRRVLITRGMMNTVRSDQELAYVMAKEMAHNALAHASRQRMSATIGGIIDNLTRIRPDMSTMVGLAGVRPMPQDLDAIADKLSLYMLARAGYDIDGAVPFWRRLANHYPPVMLNGYTAMHPATDYRISAMEQALEDIKSRIAQKMPLHP